MCMRIIIYGSVINIVVFISFLKCGSIADEFDAETFFSEMSFIEKNRADFIIEKKEVITTSQLIKNMKIVVRNIMGFKYDRNSDKLYFADMENHQIMVIDSDLNYIRSFGNYGQGPGEFNNPTSVSMFSNGDILVTD